MATLLMSAAFAGFGPDLLDFLSVLSRNNTREWFAAHRQQYERVLLEGAGKKTQTRLIEAANRLLPTFAQHALWRPKAREFIGALMRETDIRMLREDLEQGIRLANSLGIDTSGIELPSQLF